MFNWFKKHFIPHTGNEHRPHLLRSSNIKNVILIILILELSTFLLPTILDLNKTGGMAAVLPAILANLTNEQRESQNLKVLTTNPILNKAAEMKANDMATQGYFAHTSPEGKTPWYWIDLAGYRYQYAGENLAINFKDSKDVTNAWMASPTHKANIIKENYTEIGTGVAEGLYQGKLAIFVAQVYANPLIESVKKESVQNKKSSIKKVEQTAVNINTINNVLGAETKLDTEKTVDISPLDNIKETTNIILIKNEPIQEPTFFQKAFASPRNTSNIIFLIIFCIVVIALLLYIFIKIRNHHKDLIVNGLMVLVVIVAIFIANYYYTHFSMVTTESIDYANQNK